MYTFKHNPKNPAFSEFPLDVSSTEGTSVIDMSAYTTGSSVILDFIKKTYVYDKYIKENPQFTSDQIKEYTPNLDLSIEKSGWCLDVQPCDDLFKEYCCSVSITAGSFVTTQGSMELSMPSLPPLPEPESVLTEPAQPTSEPASEPASASASEPEPAPEPEPAVPEPAVPEPAQPAPESPPKEDQGYILGIPGPLFYGLITIVVLIFALFFYQMFSRTSPMSMMTAPFYRRRYIPRFRSSYYR